ncbi:MAG: DUF4340 domain-containing protein [Thermodesulfobacteriota bacterium]|nr:DUF4340 domain-containing protein [Thermodesulfobacteriota bacterium]
MKVKKEYIILGAVIVALSLYLVFRNPDRTHYELPTIPEMAEAEISKIEISKAGTTMVLNKKDDKWYMAPEGYLVDTQKVEAMLDGMETLAVTALVSESESFGRYDLNDDKKITVKAWQGETLKRNFDVGKAASSFQHTFVKLSGDNRVYHGRGNFRSQFDQTVDGLRDKTVLSFDQKEMQEIQVTKGKDIIAFKRGQVPVEVKASKEDDAEASPSPHEGVGKMVWQTADGKEGDGARIDRLLDTLSNLRCEKYIDEKKKEDLTDPIWTVQVQGAKEYTLSIFAKKDEDANNYPAISSENDHPFLLPKWQADRLMKKPDDMIKKPDES